MGRYLDGGKTYKITLPAPIPAGQFWSFMVYDGQTRSMLETDQKLAGLDSNEPDIKKNADGSVTVWFAPKAPAGQETNWVQTCRARAGTLSCAFTRRWSLGSTRAGSRAISSGSIEAFGAQSTDAKTRDAPGLCGAARVVTRARGSQTDGPHRPSRCRPAKPQASGRIREITKDVAKHLGGIQRTGGFCGRLAGGWLCRLTNNRSRRVPGTTYTDYLAPLMPIGG
jgi:hypothetical protein